MPRSSAKLNVVPATPEPAIDIYASWRAEIRARDWARCHITGDRRAPVAICDARHRQRGAETIVVRSHGEFE